MEHLTPAELTALIALIAAKTVASCKDDDEAVILYSAYRKLVAAHGA